MKRDRAEIPKASKRAPNAPTDARGGGNASATARGIGVIRVLVHVTLRLVSNPATFSGRGVRAAQAGRQYTPLVSTE